MLAKSEDENMREFAQEQRESLAQTALDFLGNELALAKTLAGVAETRYSMGHTEEADRAKHDALKAINTVRLFLQKNFVTLETRSGFAKRCDELELRVNSVGMTK